MIQAGTRLKSADNTGAKIIECIKVLGGYQNRYAGVGDIITASVKEATPHSMIKKGDVIQAVIVRTRKETGRKDGTYVRFNENAAVILDKESKEPKGTRIFGPIPREIKLKGYNKIASLAPEVL